MSRGDTHFNGIRWGLTHPQKLGLQVRFRLNQMLVLWKAVNFEWTNRDRLSIFVNRCTKDLPKYRESLLW